ncbi:MAG TPA: DNA recombination protein RmuC [Actinomycetospora sp.]|nr:DNA recombination protein RmuC [Actinomycetospora sp.]
MTMDGLLAGLLLGLVLGAGVGAWAALHLAGARRDAAVSEAVCRASTEVAAARAELDAERRGAHERERAVSPAARAASVEALDRVLEPVASALGRMEAQMAGAAREREAAFAALREQVGAVATNAAGVAGETRALVGALRAPHVRGRWGELQLERVVDLAGMVEHCDFTRQAHARGGDDDGAQRPDLVVHLAGGKQVVVDAKVPFAAYLESTEARDDTARRERVAAHAKQVRAHVETLGAKAYWRRFEPTPEFVVMFVPGEVFLSAALEADPALLEHAFGLDVVIATPTTLVALLRTVAYAWRQEALARNTAEVHALGRELHGRLATLSSHLARLGRSLDGSVRSFNETVSSLESRVLVSARRFADLSVTSAELEAPEQVERRPRAPAETG